MYDSLAQYRPAWEGLVEELAAALSTDDVDALRSELARGGFSAWKRWESENHAAISEFLRAEPAKRRKRKAWSDPALRRRLTFGALQQARLAIAVLDVRESLYPGGSWRDTCVEAAAAGRQIFETAVGWYWPFDDPDPFLVP